MAKPLRPFVRGGGFYPSRKYTPLVYPGGYTTRNASIWPHDPLNTFTGDIVQFNTIRSMPIQSLKVNMSPKQDLHGYDSPWPAGGGKNLMPITVESSTVNGVTYTVQKDNAGNVVGVHCSGTASIASFLVLNDSIPLVAGKSYRAYSGLYTGSDWGTYALQVIKGIESATVVTTGATGRSGDFVAESGGLYRTRIYVWKGQTVNATFNPMVCEDNVTDVTYAPYSNICPISGWTGCEVYDTGHNVWDEEWETGWIGWAGQNASSDNQIRSKGFIPVVAGETYRVVSSISIQVLYYDANKDLVSYQESSLQPQSTFTIPSGCAYIRFYTYYSSYGGTYKNDISINYPSTDTEYHSYNGDSYSVTFGETVYGGEVDAVSGEVPVTRGNIVYDGSDDEDIRLYSGQRFTLGCSGYISSATSIVDIIMCNRLKTVSKSQQGSGLYLISGSDIGLNQFMINVGLNTVADVRAWLAANPLQVSYPLATPIQATITPTPITALKGYNAVRSDAGPVEVTAYGTPIVEPNVPTRQALNLLLGGAYRNDQTEDDVSDEEALDILLGGADR